MRLFAEDREIFAKALPIHGGVSNFVHKIICSAHSNAPLYLKASEVSATAARRWNALSSTGWQSYCGFAARFSCAFGDCLNHRLRRSRSTFCKRDGLPLLEFRVRFREGVDSEFQISARMRC
jgi:hypothetical protein